MTMSEYCLTPVKPSVLLPIPHAILPASCLGSVRRLYTGVRLVPPPTGSNCLRGSSAGSVGAVAVLRTEGDIGLDDQSDQMIKKGDSAFDGSPGWCS